MECLLHKKSIKKSSDNNNSLTQGQTNEIADGVNVAEFYSSAGCTSYACCQEV
ncbi:hypothetical protein [Pseudoalteromonas luteoviolacea]|uniref:Uncharacterized protein n=1 Tax=Pseudoalteromonas luteoviolacea NCIMB 1942 TaxID=1365253 RepID=A0A166YA45_9GAMM|nr:hypothetical protein [Pseudoalteromonas luteoviolacea]KZN41610.1 hypothetical protein N482_20245 [Pseudoalteromonas luteoviolacea NCIMB 1942]